jgi:hypothetical protein
MGRPPIGQHPMTAAERKRRSRAGLAVPTPAEPRDFDSIASAKRKDEEIAGLRGRLDALEQEQRNPAKKKSDQTD